MNQANTNLLGAIIIAVVFFFVGRHSDRVFVDRMDKERERVIDSLQTGWTKEIAEGEALRLYVDSLKVRTDSIAATFEPETIIVTRWIKFTRFAPLDLVQDSLMTP